MTDAQLDHAIALLLGRQLLVGFGRGSRTEIGSLAGKVSLSASSRRRSSSAAANTSASVASAALAATLAASLIPDIATTLFYGRSLPRLLVVPAGLEQEPG